MNSVDLTMRVAKQEKKEKCVLMSCFFGGGKKKEDGTYPKSQPITVILTDKTEWAREDLTKKLVDVKGNLNAQEWESNGKSGVDLKIFADSVAEHVFKNK